MKLAPDATEVVVTVGVPLGAPLVMTSVQSVPPSMLISTFDPAGAPPVAIFSVKVSAELPPFLSVLSNTVGVLVAVVLTALLV